MTSSDLDWHKLGEMEELGPSIGARGQLGQLTKATNKFMCFISVLFVVFFEFSGQLSFEYLYSTFGPCIKIFPPRGMEAIPLPQTVINKKLISK